MPSMNRLLFLVYISSLIPFVKLCPDGWHSLAVDNNRCYLVVANKTDWFTAESYCRVHAASGAHLASICSQFENANLNTIVVDALTIPHAGPIWIGLKNFVKQDTFTWIDGNNCPFRNWSPGQPNGSPDSQCVASMANTNGKWTTVNCAIANYFVCEVSAAYADATDCYDLYHKHNVRQSGIYFISLPGKGQISVFCEMFADGGGWTVFHRRVDSSISFHDKTWKEYKEGFNNGLINNLWLGNDNIHALSTKDSNVELRIELYGDREPSSSHPSGYWYGKYSSFWIENEANLYTLHLSRPTAGNLSDNDHSIYYNNGVAFSTIDVSHDHCENRNCSGSFQLGGWWLNNSTYVALNGKYIPITWDSSSELNGLTWYTGTYYIHPLHCRMMMRKRAPL